MQVHYTVAYHRMKLVSRETASHWYLPDGTPFHHVARSDGNGLRPTTLRDARKVGALPSVTNALATLAKPALDAWKQEQAILAALTLPRRDGETLDAFAHRVVEDMTEQVAKASDLGSAIHAAIEAYLRTGELPEDEAVLRLFEPARRWLDEHVNEVVLAEKVTVNKSFGYAGCVDLVARLTATGKFAVIDFKSQKVKRDSKNKPVAAFYETWPLQLIAYKKALEAEQSVPHQLDDIASVVINSVEPSPVQVKVWPREEHADYWTAFRHVLGLWSYVKGYDPSKHHE